MSFIRPRLDCATQCSSRSTPSRAGGDLQRLAWRSDSCPGCEGASGEDLSGGYFEAGGSYLKFSYPLAFTITQLAWGVVEYRDGYAKVGRLLALSCAVIRHHAPWHGRIDICGQCCSGLTHTDNMTVANKRKQVCLFSTFTPCVRPHMWYAAFD